jgi:hypothetical protein
MAGETRQAAETAVRLREWIPARQANDTNLARIDEGLKDYHALNGKKTTTSPFRIEIDYPWVRRGGNRADRGEHVQNYCVNERNLSMQNLAQYMPKPLTLCQYGNHLKLR